MKALLITITAIALFLLSCGFVCWLVEDTHGQ